MTTTTRLSIYCGALLVTALLTVSAEAAAPETFAVSEFTFKRPSSFEWVETASPMRKAQLKVSDPKEKDSAEIVFFYFGPGDGGGAKANVDRWYGQFKEGADHINAKSEDANVGGIKVTYVSAEGTYLSGMPCGPKTAMPN